MLPLYHPMLSLYNLLGDAFEGLGMMDTCKVAHVNSNHAACEPLPLASQPDTRHCNYLGLGSGMGDSGFRVKGFKFLGFWSWVGTFLWQEFHKSTQQHMELQLMNADSFWFCD